MLRLKVLHFEEKTKCLPTTDGREDNERTAVSMFRRRNKTRVLRKGDRFMGLLS